MLELLVMSSVASFSFPDALREQRALRLVEQASGPTPRLS